jgi:hypothetical protein
MIKNKKIKIIIFSVTICLALAAIGVSIVTYLNAGTSLMQSIGFIHTIHILGGYQIAALIGAACVIFGIIICIDIARNVKLCEKSNSTQVSECGGDDEQNSDTVDNDIEEKKPVQPNFIWE